MFNSIIEFFRTAINQQIIGDPIWAIVAFVGQALFGGRVAQSTMTAILGRMSTYTGRAIK